MQKQLDNEKDLAIDRLEIGCVRLYNYWPKSLDIIFKTFMSLQLIWCLLSQKVLKPAEREPEQKHIGKKILEKKNEDTITIPKMQELR